MTSVHGAMAPMSPKLIRDLPAVSDMELKSWKKSPRLATIALSRLARQRRAHEVQQALEAMQRSGLRLDVIHWGAASRAFEKRNCWPQSLAMLKRADTLGLLSNEFMFSSALQSCTESSAWRVALGLALESSRLGLVNAVLTSGTISALARRWQLSVEAFVDFATRSEPSDFAYTAVIAAQGQANRWYAAVSTLNRMPGARIDPPLVSHSAALDAFAWGRRWNEAVAALLHLLTAALVPNLITFNSVLSACLG
ncbi:unnamed protein product [Symbiodinium natans]|uniref:Pentatricopeptide repeat-containing protein, chloroplastic n=1 Tax=Symbiodinium natans TaxID=878477 RepID=A0A812UU23_9DINO|nr:unnamed protein product [Symbiodinium natans]